MISTLELFPELTSELINLLKALDYKDWHKPTPITGRTVKDLVSHLVDGSLRRLSLQRDKHTSRDISSQIKSYEDLVNHIQDLNRKWIEISARLSPRILIDLLKYSESELYDFFKTLKPHDKAIFPVAWAGETESENWFDIAREYTEKWHHQMQIRMSVDKPLLMEPKYIGPLYDTFMLGLPHLFRDMTDYPNGESMRIILTGQLNKLWYLIMENNRWVLYPDFDKPVDHIIKFPESIAWKLFTNTDRNKEAYGSKLHIKGDQKLGNKLLEFTTVMS